MPGGAVMGMLGWRYSPMREWNSGRPRMPTRARKKAPASGPAAGLSSAPWVVT